MDACSIKYDKFMEVECSSNMIKRIYVDLSDYFHKNEVLILYGPRRVGKTTVL